MRIWAMVRIRSWDVWSNSEPALRVITNKEVMSHQIRSYIRIFFLRYNRVYWVSQEWPANETDQFSWFKHQKFEKPSKGQPKKLKATGTTKREDTHFAGLYLIQWHILLKAHWRPETTCGLLPRDWEGKPRAALGFRLLRFSGNSVQMGW